MLQPKGIEIRHNLATCKFLRHGKHKKINTVKTNTSIFVDRYYLRKPVRHCFHKSFFPNECKLLLSAPDHLNLIHTTNKHISAERRIFSATKCVSAVQGHPRSLIFGTNRKGVATSH